MPPLGHGRPWKNKTRLASHTEASQGCKADRLVSQLLHTRGTAVYKAARGKGFSSRAREGRRGVCITRHPAPSSGREPASFHFQASLSTHPAAIHKALQGAKAPPQGSLQALWSSRHPASNMPSPLWLPAIGAFARLP